MHIPLDYYRVLGLPIQATSEQLSHAHRDRTLQLPRREFSEWAIAARRQLIDEAYEILNDPAQRQPYDETFLSKPYEMGAEAKIGNDGTAIRPIDDPSHDGMNGTHPSGEASSLSNATIPRIEIHDNQFIGALLLLYELGEYELVLKLGRPYLSSGEKSLTTGQFGDPQIVGADIVLTIALSCLELGREQWQQGQYEAAAESLETGQELLLREGLFPTVRGEVQSDLYKLRPYRILELLALPEERAAERYQGLRLLQDILQERGGIDGKGNDQSGLSTDDFLRFIQQLRRYLSVAEQQQIFEAEASRPSAVGLYLAAYAFIAGGFAHRQPSLIQTAKQFVTRLGGRQNVSLEQSVCALLLGQTEEANYLVERSREKETLAYIRKHSEGAPDLLPGLCLYAEQWLRAEVFPQFRDLNQEDASLKDYFADPTVQTYLEALPAEEEQSAVSLTRQTTSTPITNGASRTSSRLSEQEGGMAYQGASYRPSTTTARREGYVDPSHQGASSGVGTMVGSTATQESRTSTGYGNLPLPTAERVSQLSPEGSLSHPNAQGSDDPYALQSPQLTNVPQGTTISPRSRSRSGPRIDRLLLLAALGILGLLIMWIIASRIYSWINQTAQRPLLPGEQLEIQVNRPPVPIAPPNAVLPSNVVEGGLNEVSGEKVILAWLDAKKAAMGADHDTSLLSDVLIGGPLANWQDRAAAAKASNVYLTYDYPELSIDEVFWSEEVPDEAAITVTITEVSEVYKNDQLNVGQSDDSSFSVTYNVIRDNGRWKIQSISTQ